MSNLPARPTLLEVDLDAAAHNIRAVRELVGAERKVFAVIKAGGYGFGAAEMGAVFARNGADWLGVERLGVPAEQAVKTIRAMLDLPHLRLGGICAHPHADVGDDASYADWQLARFTGVVDELEAQGVRVPVRLFAATPFVLRFPHTYLNAVDPGRALYGIIMPDETPPVPLRPALRALKTHVIALKELTPRERFAERAPFPVTAPMRLGVMPIGSADGMLWLNAGRVLVRGRAAPIVSSPSLEHTRIDLTGIPDAVVGDEVVIIGRQGDREITSAEVATRHGLGLHHVATTVGPRVSRVYLSA